MEHKAAIESVLGKPMPKEFEEFYSFCDGLQRSTYGKHNKDIAGYELLLPLEEVFDNFKIHTATLTREMLEDGTVYENEPFFENIWYDYYIDEPQTNIDTEECSIYFEFFRRQKLLCFIVGTTFNLPSISMIKKNHIRFIFRIPKNLFYILYLYPWKSFILYCYKLGLQVAGMQHSLKKKIRKQ